MNDVNHLKKKMIYFNESPVVCYRGESADYGETSLMPSIFRKINDSNFSDRKLLELLKDYNIVNSKDDSDLTRAIEGQHFAQLSRLLDITFSILPALYFSSDDKDKDGVVYSFVFPESFSPNSSYLNDYYSSIVNHKFYPYIRDFKVISHSYENDRIKSQAGGFLMFSGTSFVKIPSLYYEKTIISKSDKIKIKSELSDFFNVNEATIYPERDKRGALLEKRLINGANIIDPDDNEFFKNELNYHINKIQLEASLMQNDSKDKTVKRFIRKSKEDIDKFIDKNNNLSIDCINKKSYEELKNEADSRMNFIEKNI